MLKSQITKINSPESLAASNYNLHIGELILALIADIDNYHLQSKQRVKDSLNELVPAVLSNLICEYSGSEMDQGQILQNLKNYLTENFLGISPQLPLVPPSMISSEESAQYYSSSFHTALRYVFLNPNPLLDKAIHYIYHIREEDKKHIAYIWHAICDTPLFDFPCETIRENVKELFAITLSEIGRALSESNILGDLPVCYPGVAPRLSQFLMLAQQIEEHEQLNSLKRKEQGDLLSSLQKGQQGPQQPAMPSLQPLDKEPIFLSRSFLPGFSAPAQPAAPLIVSIKKDKKSKQAEQKKNKRKIPLQEGPAMHTRSKDSSKRCKRMLKSM